MQQGSACGCELTCISCLSSAVSRRLTAKQAIFATLLACANSSPERRHHEIEANQHQYPVLSAACRQYAIGDAACPGLCIRVTPGGVKTFAFAYRNKGTGKVTWLTLGRHPDVALAKAREIANDARKTVAGGGTPLTPKIERAEAEKN